MRSVTRKSLLVLLLSVVPLLTYGQYFQRLYDIDSSGDWGWNIAVKPDGNLFIEGANAPVSSGVWDEFNMTVSGDGSSILNENIYSFFPWNVGLANPGQMAKLSWGGYLIPLDKQISNDTFVVSTTGLMKLNSAGDSLFFKTYTDTSHFSEALITCNLLPNGGYIAGGVRYLLDTDYFHGVLIRTDSTGDTLWTHTYAKDAIGPARIMGVVPLADGRIAIGAQIRRLEVGGPPYYSGYYVDVPWYMLLDSGGNVIRDTVYNSGFAGGGWLNKDMNGGYYTVGCYDSLYGGDPYADGSLPSFIAHLDTNFRTTWITPFRYSDDTGYRGPWVVKQLHDGSYIVVGDRYAVHPISYGWAAKVNKYGEVVWNNFYLSDSDNQAHFNDVAEKPDGNLVIVGSSANDSMPTYKQRQDVWLVGVDSNGCQNVFCAPLRVTQPVAYAAQGISVYPNPTAGVLTVSVAQPGTLYISNMLGQQITSYKLSKDKNELVLPGQLPPGMYVGRVVAEDGSVAEVKIMYQP